jgi:hypothetical protein
MAYFVDFEPNEGESGSSGAAARQGDFAIEPHEFSKAIAVGAVSLANRSNETYPALGPSRTSAAIRRRPFRPSARFHRPLRRSRLIRIDPRILRNDRRL